MISASNIISIAAGQIGTTEKPINKVKYNDWFYGKEVSGAAYPWCMAFVMWVFSKAGASSLIYGGRKSAYCPTVMQWFKANGKLYKDPQPGDVVFYNFSAGHTAVHTGIVEHVGIGTITAIEGNTSSGSAGSQTNGGMVARRIRNRSCCLGFGRPSYAAAAKTAVPAANIKVEPAQGFSHTYNRRYTVTASSLNLRAGAGEDRSIIAQIPKGSSVQCFGYYTKKLGTIWLLVKCGTQTGYCSSRYLKQNFPDAHANPAGADGVFGAGTSAAYTQHKNRKPVDAIAREVIAGKWGIGRDRIDRLERSGYDAEQIQRRVNELLRRQV